MENKYRILEIKKVNGLGEEEIKYKIQKKFLFWFFNVSLLCKYSETSHSHGNFAFIIKRRYNFHNLDRVKKILSSLENPVRFKYKGCMIEKIFEDDTFKEVFINLNYHRERFKETVYEWSYDLKTLQEKIDRRKIETFRKVL